MAWVVLVLSIIVTCGILKIINRNTFGTTGAYAKRALAVWFATFMALALLFGF